MYKVFPRPLPEKISGNVNCTRVYRHTCTWRSIRGCPGVPVHGGIPIVFISIHGVVTQFVNVWFLCVPVHEDTTIDSVRQGLWYEQIFFSVTSEVEFPDNTNNLLSQMLHNPLLTLLFVRLFLTSCFDNDFAVESLLRIFSTFEALCFAVFPVGTKNDRISCRKICNYN